MKIFQSTQNTLEIVGFVRTEAFDKFSITIRNVILISVHLMSSISPLIYVIRYASDFREYSDGFYCIACGLLNFANASIIALKRPKIFKLIDNFEGTITTSKFSF